MFSILKKKSRDSEPADTSPIVQTDEGAGVFIETVPANEVATGGVDPSVAILETDAEPIIEMQDAINTNANTDAELAPGPDAPASGDVTELTATESGSDFVDFESEFGLLEIEPASVEAPLEPETVEANETEPFELEEWSEPLPSVAPPALASGTVLPALQGTLTIEEWLDARGGENVYRATWVGEGDEGEGQTVRLREAGGAWGERLARETMWRTHWDQAARMAMLPRLVCGFKNDELAYLATEMTGGGPTLAQFFAQHEAEASEDRSERETAVFLSETLLLLTQVAAFLVRLHGAGFAHLGLRPDGIVSGKPVQILDCSFAMPLGEALETPLSFAGYSAPELLQPGGADARSDVYAVGALLYRAVTGSDVPESGADLLTWKPRIAMAGVPQILRRTLGDLETRFNSAEELHRSLVKLKNRLRPALSHELCGLSTIGLEPTRTTNQDAFGTQNGAWETENGLLVWSAFVVADGMGGMAAGEVASEVAVKAFLGAAAAWSAEAATTNLAALPDATQAQLVKDWVALANAAVVKAMAARHVRGGCTIDAGLVIDRRLCIAHVGDSRLYLLRGGEFELLSRDHSFVMSLLLQGEITFEQIRTHGDRNKVTRSLGERHPLPDYFIDTLQVQKSVPSLDLQAGDVVMACSDGLWEPVLESEMLAALEAGDLGRAGRDMLRLALQRGAPDNATLVLLRLNEDTPPVFA